MQIETRQVGGVLRLGDNARIVIHRRQGERVVLGATAPAGTRQPERAQCLAGRAGTFGFWPAASAKSSTSSTSCA